MYYTIYTSSDNEENYFNFKDNYQETDNNNDNNNNDNDNNNVNICIICLFPSINNNSIETLNTCNEYILSCNCNTYIHKKCLYEWYIKTESCPICRKSIIYEVLYSDICRKYIKIFCYYLIYYNTFLRLFQLANIIFFINASFVLLYNFYFLAYYLLIIYYFIIV
jgi:hypothetical protein